MMKKGKILTRVAILTGIVVFINLISSKVFFRLDFTADKRYTLSQASKDILNDLEDVITVTAYFTEDLPPQLLTTRQDFEDLLVEYESRSGGNIIYEFVNPNQSPETETEAQQNGIAPILVNVRESDQVKQLKAYLGASLQMGDRAEIIPLIEPGAAMEYALSTSIKKLAVEDKPKVAIIQGHGEPSINAIAQLMQKLSILYQPEPYTLTDTAEIPAYYQSIAIINPQDTIPPSHFEKLDNYLEANGSLFLAHSNLSGDLRQAYLAGPREIGITKWLEGKGIVVNNQYIVDANSHNITVRQQQGPFVFATEVQFPYFPIIHNFANHPIVSGLESVILPFISSITINNSDSLVNITPLAFTSQQSGLVQAPIQVDINKEWTEGDFRDGAQIVAVAAEGPISGASLAKMVVINNGQFLVNGEGSQQQQLNEDNVNFAANAIDWLSDDTGLIELRTKGVTSRPLDPVEDSTKAILKWGNVLAPIILLLIYALVRRQQYIKKRQRWFQNNYQ